MLLLVINATNGELIKFYIDNTNQIKPFFEIGQTNSVIITDDNQLYISAFNFDKIQNVIARFDISIMGTQLIEKWSKVIGPENPSHQFLTIYLDEMNNGLFLNFKKTFVFDSFTHNARLGLIKLNAFSGQIIWSRGFEYNKTLVESGNTFISEFSVFTIGSKEIIGICSHTQFEEEPNYKMQLYELYHAKITNDLFVVFCGQSANNIRASYLNTNEESQSCDHRYKQGEEPDSQYIVAVTSEYLIKEYNYQALLQDGGITFIQLIDAQLKDISLKTFYHEYPRFCQKKSSIITNQSQWEINVIKEDRGEYKFDLNNLVKGDENCLDPTRSFTTDKKDYEERYNLTNGVLTFKYENKQDQIVDNFELSITYPDQQIVYEMLKINLLSCAGPMVIDVINEKFWAQCKPAFVGYPINLYNFITFDNITNTYFISDQPNLFVEDDGFTYWPREKLFRIEVDTKDDTANFTFYWFFQWQFKLLLSKTNQQQSKCKLQRSTNHEIYLQKNKDIINENNID
ncbi:UNKNOWN [Stylonychia lemnae]|uniref:Uncharacterized protein n=1 Tax=Stylonychia lemnae TaxID=5949 RepID=A0A078AXZ9_STYLE|nr:UNKNOWN [Stylonychia lemnae]|eukprot:CDW86976.1 UNKNOWN [Stylonychia lemnae]